ncbi:cytochrome P450 [Cubamyces lactineus]|nr:cytochrome P450 [Cubamyces lactineus]
MQWATLLPGAVIGGVSWFLWKFFRHILCKSPLDNIPGPRSDGFLYGNFMQMLDRHAAPMYDYLTDTYRGIVRLAAPLGHRSLYVYDPVALHTILLKDQHIYEEAGWLLRGDQGERHKKQRKLLNPCFSVTHMRRMIPIFTDIGHKLQIGIENRMNGRECTVEVDILSWMGRTALELIGQAGLGYSFDPLVADSTDEFAAAIKMLQPATFEIHLLHRLLPHLPEWGSPWLRRKLVELFPHKGVQRVREIVDTLHQRSVGIYEERKRALLLGEEAHLHKLGEGKDLMSILLKANMEASEEDKLPEEELIGQVSSFIFAAMDTTSNALAMTLHLLAQHPDVQDKLRKEVLEASNGEDLNYDTLVGLPYLDAVCRETLRLHTPVGMVVRESRQDTILPLSEPIIGVDGTKMHEVFVPKDTTLFIGILSCNRNKAIWGEDALDWKPERWLSPLPESVTKAKIPGIYSHLMTFIGGGRSCIGFKFSQLEMKVILYLLLMKFTFALSDKPIMWNVSGVRYPTVGEDTKPSLPLRVGLYRPQPGSA